MKNERLIVNVLDGIKVGDKMLRRKSGDGEQWVEFTVNDTYYDLMLDFPEDYRHLNGTEIEIVSVI